MTQENYIEAFEKYLSAYRPHKDALDTIADMRLVLLVGPSSSGRNAVIRELLKTDEYHFIVSDTTRSPRSNDGVPERDGVEYHFRSQEDVLNDIKAGKFLEAAYVHQKHVYGISVRELHKAHADNKIAITDVEVVGAANIYKVKPSTTILFVIPPSFPVWIERLHHRGILPEEEVRRRLQSALKEYEEALQDDYYRYVINDDLATAVAVVYEISKLQRIDAVDQAKGRIIIESLIRDTKAYLESS